ncbi:hypothetical protein FCV25MIE_18971 [Fagus crenata]
MCPSGTPGSGLHRGLEILNSLNRLAPATLDDASTSTPVNPPDDVDGTSHSSSSRGGHGRGARGGGRGRGAPCGGGRARGAPREDHPAAPESTPTTSIHPTAPESTPATSSHPMDIYMQRGPEQTEAPQVDYPQQLSQVDHPQQPQRRILPKRIKKLRPCGT